MSAPEACRHCGAAVPPTAHFCPACARILPLGRQTDYFAFLGFDRALGLDAAELERRFRELSRQFHPDYFYNATPAERRASLERASYLNDAYRTLRQPIGRLEYLLDVEGAAPRGPREASTAVPAALLEEVFALNEELDEIRALRGAGAPEAEWRGRLERARQPIEARQRAHEADLDALSARWDRTAGAPDAAGERRAVLQALRERMLERNYINNLLAGIERELTS